MNKRNSNLELEHHNKASLSDIKKQISSVLGYDSDLVEDEADRANLDKMPEIEREGVLYERRQKREQLLQRYNMLKNKKAQINNQPLTKQRQSSPSSVSSSSSVSSVSSSSGSVGLVKKSSISAIEEKKPPLVDKTGITIRDYSKIVLTRDQILDNLKSPFFEDLVLNSYARVASMTVKGAYKMVKIVDTQTTKPYPVTAGSAKEKHSVNVEFQCLHDGARYVKLNLFSNSPITEAEFIAFS